MYFAGTLAHGADHKRSSGGFIHGFRYTARALHRILEEEEEEAVAAAAPAAVGVGTEVRDRGSRNSSGAAAIEQEGRTWIDAATTAGFPPRLWPTTRVRGLRALVTLLLRRINTAAGLYQMFGHLADVFVFDALTAADVTGFVAGGPHAAMHTPWGYYDAAAAAAAASGADPSGLAAEIAASQAPAPAGASQRPTGVIASEAAIDAALTGGLREEVPLGLAARAAQKWASRAHNSSGGNKGSTVSLPAEWLVLTLEFGPSQPAGKKDPFALDRRVS
jgi:hypothetical protein